jgi:O-antigen/teichoic acid export membrane protein
MKEGRETRSNGISIDGIAGQNVLNEEESIRKYLSLESLGIRAGWLALLQLTGYLAYLLFQLYSANHLGPSDYGLLAQTLALGSFISLIGNFGSDRILVRELIQRPERKISIIQASLAQRLSLSVPAAIVLILIVVVNGDRIQVPLSIPVAIYFLLNAIDLIALFDSQRKAWLHAIGFFIRNLMMLGMFTLLVFLNGATAVATGWMMVLAASVFLLFQFSFAVRTGWTPWCAISIKDIKDLFRITLPLAIATAAVQIYMQFPIIVLGWTHDKQSAGLFAVAFNLAVAISGLIGTVYRLILPELSRLAKTSLLQTMLSAKRVSRMMLFISLVLTLAVWHFSPWIIGWFRPDYKGSLGLFRIMLVIVPLVSWGSVFGNTFLAIGEVSKYVFPVIIGALVSIATCVAFIPSSGAIGASVVMAVTQASVVFCSAVLFFRSSNSHSIRAAEDRR